MRRIGIAVVVLVLALPLRCSAQEQQQPAPAAAPQFSAEAWDAADALFRRDKHWVGGDGAYSIDLGAGRVLWMFGDSLIDPTGAHSRKSAGVKMVSDTVAIQSGYDPSAATMNFAWRTVEENVPSAFFPDHDDFRYWPGDGIRVRDRLLIFLMKVKHASGGLGFDVYDWDVVLVHNPDADPSAWELTWLETPENKLKVIVGSATVLVEGEFVYAFSAQETRGHAVYLVRWPLADFYEGELRHMEWWSEGDRWTADQAADSRPAPVLRDAATEFTVHRDPKSQTYLQVQSEGFGPANVVLRRAGALTGPWSDKTVVYRPPEFDKARIMIYQGKAHPHLTGADLVLTYSTNSFDFPRIFDDADVYYPRFVRLTRK